MKPEILDKDFRKQLTWNRIRKDQGKQTIWERWSH
ncbi:hypothetical protein ACJIZ3_004899 [Penstemon smallii]|uniref:Uncharacterized protein n=1 Tax=Penstemon smallii TaxID=265156 RepID=A0ABD3S3B6_9LAMI